MIATNTSLAGDQQNVIYSPFDAVVLGMTTLPATAPGDPICHLAKLESGPEGIEAIRRRLSGEHMHEQLLSDLATNLTIQRERETNSFDPSD